MTTMRIEMMPLTTLLMMEFHKNPKAHDLEALHDSFRRFGFKNPPTIDEASATMVAGHGRCKTLTRMREDFESPPDGITIGDGGEWMVPVIRGLRFENERERDAYVIADNQHVIAGGWNFEALGHLVAELAHGAEPGAERAALAGVGFQSAELDALLAGFATVHEAGPADEDDEVPPPGDDDIPMGSSAGTLEIETPAELPKRTITKPGDVWKLGDHRLVCGDMQLAEVMAAALAGRTVDLVWTHPPVENVADTKRRKKLDESPPIVSYARALAAAVTPGTPIYLATVPADLSTVDGALRGAGFHWSSTIAWVQQSLVAGRTDFHAQWAPIFYGWLDGAARRCAPTDRSISDVWTIDRPRDNAAFPTLLPVALVARGIDASTKHGGLVLDAFGGAGTTLLAAAQIGRVCAMIEADPAACDVVVDRWQSLTGQKATR